MAQFSTKLGIFSLVIGLTIISLGDSYGADWKLLSKSARGLYYYDRETIEQPLSDVKRVWVVFYPSEVVASVFEVTYGEGYADFSYSTELVEIHCRKKWARVIVQESHSSNGAFIGCIYDRLPTPWVIPGKSNIGAIRLLEVLCK